MLRRKLSQCFLNVIAAVKSPEAVQCSVYVCVTAWLLLFVLRRWIVARRQCERFHCLTKRNREFIHHTSRAVFLFDAFAVCQATATTSSL